jgi:hypothetical protein
MANLKDLSKGNYDIKENSFEAINAGSLQRIADAAEMMAKNYIQLKNELDRYKRWYQAEVEKNKTLSHSNAGLKGQITKLKSQLTDLHEAYWQLKESQLQKENE